MTTVTTAVASWVGMSGGGMAQSASAWIYPQEYLEGMEEEMTRRTQPQREVLLLHRKEVLNSSSQYHKCVRGAASPVP